MNKVVIIPSRYGSKRFEGKPLSKILGKPMIQRVYERAAMAKHVSDVIVATDDSRIMETVLSFNGKAIMTSENNRSGTDRVGEAAQLIKLGMDDIVVNLQGDQPLFEPESIDEVIEPLLYDSNINMSTLAFKIINKDEIINPKDVKLVFDNNNFAIYFSRASIPFGRDAGVGFDIYKHLGIYAYRRSFLEIFRNLPEGRLERIEKLEMLRAMEYGYKIKVIVTEYDSPEVDIPDDINKIESIIKKVD